MAAIRALYASPYTNSPLHYSQVPAAALSSLMAILSRAPPPDSETAAQHYYQHFLNIAMDALPRGLLVTNSAVHNRNSNDDHHNKSNTNGSELKGKSAKPNGNKATLSHSDGPPGPRLHPSAAALNHCRFHHRLRSDVIQSIARFIQHCVDYSAPLLSNPFFAPLTKFSSTASANSHGNGGLEGCLACAVAGVGQRVEVLAALLSIAIICNCQGKGKDVDAVIGAEGVGLVKGWMRASVGVACGDEMIVTARRVAGDVLRRGGDGLRKGVAGGYEGSGGESGRLVERMVDGVHVCRTPVGERRWGVEEWFDDQRRADGLERIMTEGRKGNEKEELITIGLTLGKMRSVMPVEERLRAMGLEEVYIAPLMLKKRCEERKMPVRQVRLGNETTVVAVGGTGKAGQDIKTRSITRETSFSAIAEIVPAPLVRSAFSFSDEGEDKGNDSVKRINRHSPKWHQVLGWPKKPSVRKGKARRGI